MTTVQNRVEQPQAEIVRYAHIQRRLATTGKFDGVWYDVSPYVKNWGTMELAIDDVRFNNFTDKGVALTVRNDDGKFNHQSNASSLWFGYLGRVRSLLRIQAAYLDTDMTTTVPADPTLGIFILDQEISIGTASNDVYLRASSLKSIFDEVRAIEIVGLVNVTATASQVMAKIRDHSDGAGNNVFREFITATSWSLTSTTNPYLLTTDTLQDMSVWEVMDLLAESEGFVVMMTRTGGIEFRARTARQAASQFAFTGQNFPRPNVVAIEEYKDSLDKFYSYFNLKYLPADTSTSYVHAGTTTVVNASNPSWLYGSRQYDFENLFPSDTATAQAIVNNLFSLSTTVPVDVAFQTTFVPGLEVMDLIDISYRSYDLANNALWDVFVWDVDKWGQEGVNFDFNSTTAFITGIRLNLDDMTHNFTARLT